MGVVLLIANGDMSQFRGADHNRIPSSVRGVHNTGLGWGGGRGRVVGVVLLSTGDVVAERVSLFLVGHRVEKREGVES